MADNILAYFRMARKTLRKRKDRKTKTRRMKGGSETHSDLEQIKLGQGGFIPFDAVEGYSKYLRENKDKNECYEIYRAMINEKEYIEDIKSSKILYIDRRRAVYVGNYVGDIDAKYRDKQGLNPSHKYIFTSPVLGPFTGAQEFDGWVRKARMNTHHVGSWNVIKRTSCIPYVNTEKESKTGFIDIKMTTNELSIYNMGYDLIAISKNEEKYKQADQYAKDKIVREATDHINRTPRVKDPKDIYLAYLEANKDKCFQATIPIMGGWSKLKYMGKPWINLGKYLKYIPPKRDDSRLIENYITSIYVFENFSITPNYALREVACGSSAVPVPVPVVPVAPILADPVSLGWTPVTENGETWYECDDKSEWKPTTKCSARAPAAAPAPMPAAALPTGWELVTDPSDGARYYECKAKEITQWEKPTVPC